MEAAQVAETHGDNENWPDTFAQIFSSSRSTQFEYTFPWNISHDHNEVHNNWKREMKKHLTLRLKES